ncbi:hypothetical protein L210DRAFT_932919 [Boletus edulis BED1]|uniref:Uncharacterized protein n=1 Tax=Boletus edulis BED1 TaxID=1328754 RepID=A0AAD4BKV9_BOLED|nr:hypothetical protein L210DRAFT_932919 [Boletus edulis BED1]
MLVYQASDHNIYSVKYPKTKLAISGLLPIEPRESVFLSGSSSSSSSIGKKKQPAIKRITDQMEMDLDEEEEHMRQSQHPRLKPEKERRSPDDETQGDTTTVDVELYTWEMFHKAIKECDIEVDFDTPILLCIL